MVDVTRASGVYQGRTSGKQNREQSRGDDHPNEDNTHDSPYSRRLHAASDVEDVTQIMGVPTSEMTPRVQAAFSTLITEFDRTRADLAFERERISRLQEQADRHPVLPASNRRVLLRELARVINRAAQTRTRSSLAVFSLQGIERIRFDQGRAAADRVLTVTAQTLGKALRASDVVSSLGGGDFGVVLTLTEGNPAEEKIKGLCADIQKALQDRGIDRGKMEIAWGMADFGDTDDAERVLTAADRDLLARWGSLGKA